MSTTRQLTDAEREQPREQDRQRLHEAANRLLTSEGWQRWVHVRARGGLARLSLNNQLLVALCCPEATLVAGFKAWLSLGYCVRKGETAIRIIAPMPVKVRRDDDVEADSAGDGRPRVLFKAVSVFDTLSRVWPRWRQKCPLSGYPVMLMLLLAGWRGGVGVIRGRRGAGARRAAASRRSRAPVRGARPIRGQARDPSRFCPIPAARRPAGWLLFWRLQPSSSWLVSGVPSSAVERSLASSAPSAQGGEGSRLGRGARASGEGGGRQALLAVECGFAARSDGTDMQRAKP
jgi:hypothetical protein